jgi:formylglycine-generating enzyme
MQCCVPQSTDPNIGTPCAVNGVAGVCLAVSDCTGDDVTPTPGLCPGPSSVQCCAATPTSGGDTCDPDAHPLPNAGLTEAPGDPGCPDGMVAVTAALCIDRYEASLVEVLSDGSTQSWSPYFNPGARTVRAVSLAAAAPQGYINGTQAAAACARAEKRLCTDTEWLRACQGAPATTYPYGDTRQPGVCNDARAVHPAVEYFGTSASWIFSRIDHPCLNQLPDSLALTGDHPGCVTDEGALDMMGNLHEWTADPAGTFRGGFYVDTYRNGNGCLYRTTAHDTSHWDYSTGFRCCADRQ